MLNLAPYNSEYSLNHTSPGILYGTLPTHHSKAIHLASNIDHDILAADLHVGAHPL